MACAFLLEKSTLMFIFLFVSIDRITFRHIRSMLLIVRPALRFQSKTFLVGKRTKPWRSLNSESKARLLCRVVTEEFLVLGIKIRGRTTKGRWGWSHISMPFTPSCSVEDTDLPAVGEGLLAASARLQPLGSDLVP